MSDQRIFGGEKYTYKNPNNERYVENKLCLSIFIIMQYLLLFPLDNPQVNQ